VIFSRNGPLSDKPVWRYSGANSDGNNWVVRLVGADYVSFRNIEFEATGTAPWGRILFFQGNVDFTSIQNCELSGFISSDDDAILVFQDFASDVENLSVTGSIFSNGKSAITLNRATAGYPVIIGNSFNAQISTGISLVSGFALIDGNTFADATFTDAFYYALSVQDLNATIRNNSIDMDKGYIGINSYGSTPAAASNVAIINNRVAVGSVTNANSGISVSLSGASLLHNTVWMEREVAPALKIAADVTDTTLLNNNFYHAGNGLAMWVNNDQIGTDPLDAIGVADYNNYYSTSGFVTLEWDGVTYHSLSDFYYDSGVDRHSTRLAVNFVDDVSRPRDLHLASPSDSDIGLLAPALAEVPQDADGDLRGLLTTYKGADEGMPIAPLDNADTASGFYTVGGASPDYPDPGSALDDLQQRGMKGPVSFRVRAGTYVFQRSIDSIIRSGAPEDLILLRPANVANKPVFQRNTTDPDENWVIKVDGTDHVKIRDIVFESTSTGNLGRLLHLAGDTSDFTLDRCEFIGVTGHGDLSAALVHGDSPGQERMTFANNVFTNGSYGLYLAPPELYGDTTNDDTMVLENTFDNQETTAFFSDHGDITFEANTVSNTRPSFLGLYLRNEDKAVFLRNHIHLTGSGSIGIQFDNYDGTFIPKSIIANNFISAGTGIDFLGDSGAWHIYHNTIRGADLAMNFSASGTSIEIINNILINTVSGPVLSVPEASDIEIFDYNRLHKFSGNLIHWGGVDYANLSSFIVATGLATNSTETTVTFVDAVAGDLHLAGGSVGDTFLSGTALADVIDDIDAETRGAVPYMGADESVELPIPNLSPPVITPGQGDSVAEDTAIATAVMTVVATDPDIAPEFQDWTITGGNTGAAFAIDPTTGTITVAAGLDRETTDSYDLQVTVSDGVYVSIEESVAIVVTDVNDNAPVITPGQGDSVAAGASIGTEVMTVVATDPDIAPEFQDWTITGGNTGNAFAIGAATGIITVNVVGIPDSPPSYTLLLTVSDGDNVSAEESVVIDVTDLLADLIFKDGFEK
jgi:hypothetical protein